MKVRQHGASEQGFTLTETIIAVAAMGAGIVALLYGLSNSVFAVNTITNSRMAIDVARSQIAYVQAQSFDLADEGTEPHVHYLQIPSRYLPSDWTVSDSIDMDVTQLTPNLQQVIVSVHYVNRDFSLTQYKVNQNLLGYAIFAEDADGGDETVTIEGSNWHIQGDVLSKSGVTLAQGAGNTVNGDVTYLASSNFHGDENDVWGTIEGEEIVDNPPPIDYKLYSDLGTPTFNFSVEPLDSYVNNHTVNLIDVDEVWLDADQKTQLKPGIYYYDSDPNLDDDLDFHPEDTIVLSNPGSDVVSGQVTIISDNILITGDNFNLWPYTGNILAWVVEENQQLHIAANSSVFNGILYAPNAEVTIGESGTPVTDDVFAVMLVVRQAHLYGEGSSIGF